MEGSGSATIKNRSPSKAPRGRGNLSKQKPHNHCLDRTPDCTFWTRIVASNMADRKTGER